MNVLRIRHLLRWRNGSLLIVELAVATVAMAAGNNRTPTPLGAPFYLSACGGCQQFEPKLVGTPTGDLLAAWTEGSPPQVTTVVRSFTNGLQPGPESTLGGTFDTRLTGIAALAAGGFVAAWQDLGEITFQALAADGSSFGTARRVNTDLGPFQDADATLFADSSGTLLFTWDRLGGDGGQIADVAAQIQNVDGLAAGATAILGTAAGRPSPRGCLRADGSAVVVWMSIAFLPPPEPVVASLSVGLFGPDLLPLIDTQELLTEAVATLTLRPAVSCASDGTFAVVWHTNRAPARRSFDVVMQRFGAAGNRIGGPSVVNARLDGDQHSPSLLREPDGRLLVVWSGPVGNSEHIRGRLIAKNGRPSGAEFSLVKAAPGVALVTPGLAPAGPEGRFALAWKEGPRLRGRLYRP